MKTSMKHINWRCAVFVLSCVLLIVAGGIHLRWGNRETDFGLSKALPPAMMLLGGLAIASPWLIDRKLPSLTVDDRSPEDGWRAFWGGVAIALLTAGILWGQRLDTSLWTDETTTMRQNMVGRWKHKGGDRGRLLRPSWEDTWLKYDSPNNHTLYSGVARFTHERLAGINESDFSRPYFNEVALRLPAFVAALLTIPLVGYLALRLCSLLAAWLAMGWAVLHPWFLEFSTSARGYAFAMFGLALACVSLVRIFQRKGGWRWWVAFGFAQTIAFATIPTVAHTLILLNLAAFLGLLLDRSVDRGARMPHLRAFLVTNLTASALAAASILPKLAPLSAYFNSGHYRSEMRLDWMGDCLSNLFVGHPYRAWSTDNPWAFATEQWPVWLLGFTVLFSVLAIVAASRLALKRGVFLFGLALAILLPPFTVYCQGHAMKFYLFPWYVVWQLPLWIALISAGAVGLTERLVSRGPVWVKPIAFTFLLLAVAIATHRPRRALLAVPVEPQRESAALMRTSPNPFAPGHQEIITTSLVTANHSYDPWNRRLRTADDLWEQIATAETTGHPLFCDTAWIERVRSHHPAVAELLLDPSYFEPVGEPLYGLQRQNTRRVFRYRLGSLKARLPSHFKSTTQTEHSPAGTE